MDDVEIKLWLDRYLRREIILREFQRWFVPSTWNIDETENRVARDIAAYIDLKLAEFSNRHWTEDELREQLGQILENQTYEIEINFKLTKPQFYSTARPVRFAFSGILQ
jgi:hypothetical protein